MHETSTSTIDRDGYLHDLTLLSTWSSVIANASLSHAPQASPLSLPDAETRCSFIIERSNLTDNADFHLAVSQILDSLEDTQWLTIGDRVELDFLQRLFEDKQLRNLLEVNVDLS